jgi:glutathione peroxidase
MKKIATWVGVFCCIIPSLQAQNKIMNTSIYQYVVSDINGDDFDFSSLKGKKIMVVNTASKCGLTPQYKKLQALYDRFKDSGFVVIGFPSNNFLWQEPGTNEDIGAFCEKNYGVSFPMMSKINVKGSKKHPVYQFLTQKNKNGLRNSSVSWNFQKYLIDEEGQLVDVVSPRTQPDDEKILNWIKS